MHQSLKTLLIGLSLVVCAVARAGSGWSSQDYDLYPGDFNGDGLTDMLYIARDPSHSNGIVLSDGTGLNTSLQVWGNAYLGIPWSGGVYNIIVADFDGDGKADILLQRKTPGDHFLLLTDEGGVTAISQTIPNDAAGLSWSADGHRLVAGDFNGDGKADLFFQALDEKGLNAVVLADASGRFTANKPTQSWLDGFAGLNWSANKSNVYSADFNGDGRSDLLVQADPLPGTGPGTLQPAHFVPNSNGVVLSQGAKKPFNADGLQAWNQSGFGANWSPLSTAVVTGDFNGDGRADVLLQGQTAADTSYLLYGRGTGGIFTPALALGANGSRSADGFMMLPGRFTSGKDAGVYVQSRLAGQTNQLAGVLGTGIAVTAQDAQLVVPMSPMAVSSNTTSLASARLLAPALLTPTSAGRTAGQFAVSAMGGATYQIPIWTPPGARGIEPHLAITYASGGPDGNMGPGWALSGLSSIARCGKTYAENGGAPARVTLTMTDDFCLDGNRLRVTSGTYGAAGSQYQTEIANFSRVTANGTSGNGPSYFVVEGKDGVTYEYGNSTDSKAFASSTTTPYAWMLNKVRDRQGNNLIVVYATTSGAVAPSTIQYTQTPNTGTTYPYTVSFTYQARIKTLSKYIAGGGVQETQILSKVNVQSSGVSVRQYNMTYATAPTTQRDRLSSIQECAGSAGTDCLRATTVGYQDGTAGVSSAAPIALPFPAGTVGAVGADYNGDGKPDLWYVNAGLTYIMLSAATGYGSAISTGYATLYVSGDVLGTGQDGYLADNAGTLWYYTYNGTSFVGVTTGLPTPTGTSHLLVDTEGKGRPNLIVLNNANVYVYQNTSSGSTPAFSTTATLAYSLDPAVINSNLTADSNSLRAFDFDGDGRKDIIAKQRYHCGTVQEPDICESQSELISAGTTFTLGASFVNNAGGPISDYVNWNSDGCTDLVLDEGLIYNTVYVSPCNGSTPIQIQIPTGINVGTMDWNGDGLSDVLVVDGTNIGVYLSTGVGASAIVHTTVPYIANARYQMRDLDGDGLDELINVSVAPMNYYPHNGAGTPSDLATSISDGWNVLASPTYVPITQGNYTKENDVAYPVSFPDYKVTVPIYVVSRVSQSDGLGTTSTNNFWYFNAVANRQGRGVSGFSKTQSQDTRNNLYQYAYYSQTSPYTGMLTKRETYQPDNATILAQGINTLNVTVLAGGTCSSASSRCFPYVQESVSRSYELTSGTTPVQISDSTYSYDTNGNPLTASTTTTDTDPASPNFNGAWTSAVTNTYGSTNTTTWCLDKPTRTTTANTAPGQATQTRTVDHVVDTSATTCRVTSETVEPNSTTLKAVTNYGYDNCGNVNSVGVVGLDKNGTVMPTRTATTSYGARCTFPESVTNALSQISGTTYNYSLGVKASSTDPNNVVVSWLYDNYGRKTRENRADLTYSTWQYDDCLTITCSPALGSVATDFLRLKVTETRFDSGSASVTSGITYADGLERARYIATYRILGTLTWTKTTYDSLGRKVDTYLPYSSTSNGYHEVTYDLLNRPTSDKLFDNAGGLNRNTSVGYAGLRTTITDARSNSTIKWTDVTGKLRRIIDPAPGGTTNYTYDPFGNLVTIVDAKLPTGATTSYVYNIRGFKTDSTDPDTGHWIYTPDSLNELATQVDAKNQVTSFGYDLLGRMISRTEPESTTATTWTYGTSAALHEIGRVKSLSKPDGYAESYTYDSLGRSSATNITEDTAYSINYAYNALGAVDTVTYPASTGTRFALKYLYSYGALQLVKDNVAGTVFWSLSGTNDSSLPTTEVLGNGVNVSSTYTPWTNELTTRKEGMGGVTNSLQDLAYQWDPNGNLQQRQDLKQLPNQTEIFVHDTLNRMSSSTLNGATNLTVGYDEAGNITSKSDVGSYDYTTAQGACNYSGLTTQPHAVRKAGTAVYCYDANGNATSRQAGALAWTSYNLPSSIAFGSNSTTFNYNASHQRWKQDANYGGVHEVTYYIGGIMEKTTKGTGPTEYRHLIPAGSNSAILVRRSDLTNSTYYTTSDHLGSGDLVLDSSVNVLARESFTPFGARRGSNWQGVPTTADYTVFSNTTRRGFTGHEMLDAVGLVHMNGRVYDPTIGRFLSADPIIQTITTGQAMNPFSYVMNMPLTLTDPSGLSWFSKLWKSITTVFIGAIGFVFAFALVAPLASNPLEIATAWYSNKVVDRLLVAVPELQPIAQAAACYWGGPWGCAAASAHIAQLNGARGGQIALAGVMGYLGGGKGGSFANFERTVERSYINKYATEAVAKVAEKNGLTGDSANAILMALSFVADEAGKSRLQIDVTTGNVDLHGILSRGWYMAPFDVIDIALGYEGLPTGAAWRYLMDYKGVPIVSHSLGALDASNLVAWGVTSTVELNALPFGGIALKEAGVTVRYSSWDFVNGFGLATLLNSGATNVHGTPFNHSACTVYERWCTN